MDGALYGIKTYFKVIEDSTGKTITFYQKFVLRIFPIEGSFMRFSVIKDVNQNPLELEIKKIILDVYDLCYEIHLAPYHILIIQEKFISSLKTYGWQEVKN